MLSSDSPDPDRALEKVRAAGFQTPQEFAQWFYAAMLTWAEMAQGYRTADAETGREMDGSGRARWREIAAMLGLPGKRFDKILHHDAPVDGSVLRGIAMIPQQTFQEARNTAIALCDGRRLERWQPISGEIALRHLIPGQPLEHKLAFSKWWDREPSREGLEAQLQGLDHRAALLLHVALYLALGSAQTTISLDELIQVLGWDPRSTAQRQVQRGTIWDWLRLLDSLIVIGQRPGTYRDPMTHRELDLRSEDSLVTITGLRRERGAARDAPPIEVTLAAGPWLDAFRRNTQVLAHFGNIMQIAKIPARKAVGAWTQTIALALNQTWREGIRASRLGRTGEAGRPTVAFPPVTRRKLLGMFHCEPQPEDLLRGEHPGRAEDYWEDSIRSLKEIGWIGFYKELVPLPARRRGRAEAWLDQPLDIRPGMQGLQDAVELKKATRRRARRR